MNYNIKNIPNLAQQSLHYCSQNYCIDCSRFHCSSFSRNHCTSCSCLHERIGKRADEALVAKKFLICELHRLFRLLNIRLVKWTRKRSKFRRYGFANRIYPEEPYHGEYQVLLRERLEVKLP